MTQLLKRRRGYIKDPEGSEQRMVEQYNQRNKRFEMNTLQIELSFRLLEKNQSIETEG